MKTFIFVLALAALVAVSLARPSGGRRGRGGRGGHGGGPKGGKPCNLIFNNGTSGETSPCLPGGLFVCEDLDLSTTDDQQRRPRRFENVTAVGFCRPKTCNDDAECQATDASSVCSAERVEPDADAMDAVMQLCFPGKPARSNSGGGSSESRENGNASETKRCSIPAAMLVAKRACSVEIDGNNFDTPCRGRKNTTVACNQTAACTVNFGSQSVALHFCERPERPAGGNDQAPPSGDAQPLTAQENDDDNDEDDDVVERPRPGQGGRNGRGNGQRGRGNRRN